MRENGEKTAKKCRKTGKNSGKRVKTAENAPKIEQKSSKNMRKINHRPRFPMIPHEEKSLFTKKNDLF